MRWTIGGERKARSALRWVCLKRILRHLAPVVHPVVSDNGGDAKPVVGKDRLPTRFLGRPVRFECPPLSYGFFILPEGERKNFSRVRKALEALYRYKTVDLFQVAAQSVSGIQVVLFSVRIGKHLKYHGDHKAVPMLMGSIPSVPSTTSTKLRSSLRINLRSWAIVKFAWPSSSLFSRDR